MLRNGNEGPGVQAPNDDQIVVEGPMIIITRPTAIEAEKGAAALEAVAPSVRLAAFTRLVEAGAEAESLYKSNVTAQLMEHRLESFADALGRELAKILRGGGEAVEGRIIRALHKHEKDLIAWTHQFTDPVSDDGLPAIVARRLRQVTDTAIEQVNALLADSDTGALAKWAKKINQQIQDSERNILNHVIRKQAIENVGFHKGRNYEEAISVKLGLLAVLMGGQVARCSDTLGVKRTRHGDHLLTFETAPFGGTVRVVVEEKSRSESQRFSHDGVQKECELARLNREASASVFISESRECLPDGVGFGQVGRGDFFVEYDPNGGDDVPLLAALYLAQAAALQILKPGGPGPVDRVEARRVVEEVRDRVERRTRIQTLHNTAVKAIHNAGKAVDDDAQAILAALTRLDGLLVA